MDEWKKTLSDKEQYILSKAAIGVQWKEFFLIHAILWLSASKNSLH